MMQVRLKQYGAGDLPVAVDDDEVFTGSKMYQIVKYQIVPKWLAGHWHGGSRFSVPRLARLHLESTAQDGKKFLHVYAVERYGGDSNPTIEIGFIRREEIPS